MAEELESGFSQATDLAEFVMQVTGLDYRSAYRIVGATVRRASQLGLRGIDITTAMVDEAAQEICEHALGVDPDQLAEVLNPRNIVASRTASGGAAPEVVEEMAERFGAQGSALIATAGSHIAQFEAAETALLEHARQIVNR